MNETTELQSRIDRLTARARAGDHSAAFVRRIEDVLGQGYAQALELDAQRRRLDREMDQLAPSITDMEALIGLRRVALQARTFDGRAKELRARLGELREQFMALGGTRITH